jgi:type V secretory pathway adhesin AidA
MADNSFPTVPLSSPNIEQHLRLVSSSLNNTINGKLNSTGAITLRASETTTTLTDARIGGNSVILFMPITANARTALDTMYVSARSSGSATLTHASSGNTDQNLTYTIIG